MALADLARLGWWLGPKASAPPPPVDHEAIVIPPGAPGERPIGALIYTPRGRAPDGALLLVPGLHPDGPRDPRMIRFASVLAHAGLCVLAPTLPDLASLRLSPALMPDTARAFAALEARVAGMRRPVKPGVMSISFGALPALRLAGHPDHRARIGGVLTFGGYARWPVALRFAMVGGDGVPFDPLNRPAAFMQLFDGLPPLADRARVEAAWRGFIDETWGRDAMKVDGAWQPVAERWAATVHADDHDVARCGLGIHPDGPAVADAAVERIVARGDRGWLDPRPAVPHIAAPLYIVHGVDDDVIPAAEAQALAGATRPDQAARVLLTGAWGHTGRAGGALGEVRSTIGVLRALRAIATRR